MPFAAPLDSSFWVRPHTAIVLYHPCGPTLHPIVSCDFVDSRTTPFPEYKLKTPVTIPLSCTLVSDTCQLVPALRGGEIIVF